MASKLYFAQRSKQSHDLLWVSGVISCSNLTDPVNLVEAFCKKNSSFSFKDKNQSTRVAHTLHVSAKLFLPVRQVTFSTMDSCTLIDYYEPLKQIRLYDCDHMINWLTNNSYTQQTARKVMTATLSNKKCGAMRHNSDTTAVRRRCTHTQITQHHRKPHAI